MYVSARPKSSNKLPRGMRSRRLTRGGLHGIRPAAPAESPAGFDQSPGSPVEPTRKATPIAGDEPARTVDNAGQSLDLASYSCECGYVFEAQVSTTVDCPHCGASQAW